ncbi:MAG: type II toxin-antitoxin system RelB/DinJ family antitoxin [Christensenellaceae bacterium]|nr:type II toxin-antitoxin system RelB/DinJ family antitoxin [Christensenellaceae bacterium]
MQKTGTIYARVDAETKKQAEKTLDLLGLSMGEVISALLKQIVYSGAVPFKMTLPEDIRQKIAENLVVELDYAHNDAQKNGWWTMKETFDML